MNVAETILKQLGGRKFSVMTGSKKFIAGKNSLSFKLVRNKSKANYCRIKLNGMDLYDMEFFAMRNGDLKLVTEQKDIYNDMLQTLFTDITGLYTRL